MASGYDEAVIELLAGQRFDRHSSWETRVVLRCVRSGASPLIGAGLADRFDHEARVEPKGDKCRRKFVEQFGIAGRIVVVEIIHRIDDSNADKLTPQTINRSPREISIYR